MSGEFSRPRKQELSRRQLQIVARIARGKTNPCIAEELGIAPNTVQTQIRRAMDKTKTTTRTQLWQAAFREEDSRGRYRYRIPEIDMDGTP